MRHHRENSAGARAWQVMVIAGALWVAAGSTWGQVAVPSRVLANPPFEFTGESEPGVPFPLPQAVGPNYRPKEVGGSNALAVSWDGKLIMYWDSQSDPIEIPKLWQGRPAGTAARGFVFATFDRSAVASASGRPDFSACFGTPFPRFAETSRTLAPGNPAHIGNDYPFIPGPGGYTDYYPHIMANPGSDIGGLGELGLLLTNFLSNIMYPVPDHELPSGAHGNPYSSDAQGNPVTQGPYTTYRAVVTLQDIPKFWDPGANPQQWKGYNTSSFFTPYEPGVYPNGVNVTSSTTTMKRNGACRLEIVVDHAAGQVIEVEVLDKWEPFDIHNSSWQSSSLTEGLSIPITPNQDRMWADNFEPTLSLDGHLMVAKGSDRIVKFGGGGSRVVFYYNQTPFGETVDGGGTPVSTPWQGPWDLHHLYLHRNDLVAGQTLAERYPLARQPIRDYDGTILGDGILGGGPDGVLTQAEADAVPFEGGYTWLSHDGRFLIYTVQSGGVGLNHPTPGNYPQGAGVLADGGGTSNRAQVSIVGSVTGWQMWKIDHAAVNPSRHYFTAWDQASRTVNLRTASFGFGPGFWDLLRGAPQLPLATDGNVKLQLVNSNRLLYYEVDLEPHQQRDYGFYLPMTVMLDLIDQPSPDDTRREVDITRSPDLSGNGHFAHVPATGGGKLPCEYFDLPTVINTAGVPGLYNSTSNPANIHPAWTSADTIQGPPGQHWAPLADWVEGVDVDDDGTIDTTPHTGRGNKRDMDSDDCWGRVGQAMFFEDSTEIYVDNDGTAAELNPGTTVAGASDALAVSLWVNPIQNRTTAARLFDHHVHVELRKGAVSGGQQQGRIAVAVEDSGGTLHWLTSTNAAAPLFTWTHVAMVWEDTAAVNQSELRLYVDGVEVPNSPLALGFDRLATNASDIRIGCLTSCATTTNRAVLLLDEVALKNSTLTAREAADFALVAPSAPSWDNSGLPEPPPFPFVNADDAQVPTTNPYHPDVARLGADLFQDVRLSANQTTSCASCHDPSKAFTDELTTAIGFDGFVLPRNTPTIYNRRFSSHQFWDSRAVDLEDQAVDPILNAEEMGMTWSQVKAYLEGDTDYLSRFDAHLGTSGVIDEDDVRKAIATYMRSPVAGDSVVDRFLAGTASLTDSQLAGQALFFGKARCSGCHHGKNFSDERLWTTGTFRSDGFDDGAFEDQAGPGTRGRAKFIGAFKTPTLRELTRTGPYFHDGHAAQLSDVIAFYNAGGVRQDGTGYPLLDPVAGSTDPVYHVKAEEINRPLGLTATEMLDLEAYLVALTSLTVDDGAIGFNQPPTVTITSQTVTSGGPPPVLYSVNIIVDVTDPDGQADLDPTNMPETLELEVGATYDWSDGTVTPIPNGYRFTKNFRALPFGSPVQVRAADWHGLWSGWVAL